MATRSEFMKTLRRRVRLLPVLAWWLWAAGFAGAQGGAFDGVAVRDGFEPGVGAPVGEVRLLQGDVAAMHAEDAGVAYRLTAGDPVFKGDTLLTGETGKVSIELADGSRITLTVNTRLTINESVYNPEQLKTRTSFISLLKGKARFFVRKLAGMDSSDFKVKTRTAVIGVRGSDFAVEIAAGLTRVTAFEETLIEVMGLVVPCPRLDDRKSLDDCRMTPMLVADFEQAMVVTGGFPEMVGEKTPEEIQRIKEEFVIEAEAGPEVEREEEPDIRVSADDLEDSGVGVPRAEDAIGIPEPAGVAGTDAPATDFEDVATDQAGDVLDDELQRLPGFPELPPPRTQQ